MTKKRARAQTQDGSPHRSANPQPHDPGQELRRLLLDKFYMGELPASSVAEISHWVTKAGGRGVGDLALAPAQASRHGHEHIVLHAGNLYPESNLTFVQVPLFVKREGRRSTEAVPMVLPSTLFRDFVETKEVLDKSAANYDTLLKGLPCYEEHPLVQQFRADGAEHSLRPVAIYWDGVQYSVHDSFTGFYVTDILSQQKFVSFLLRWALSVLGWHGI